MTVIPVADRFGPICVSAEDGATLCALIRESLDRPEAVTLDFTGVTTLASLFLNGAVGCLYASYSKDFLDEKLAWMGLDPADESVIRFVKRNAIRFYAAKADQQVALIAAAGRSTEE
jgi:hypothetical protein